jgi:hypothetical protein
LLLITAARHQQVIQIRGGQTALLVRWSAVQQTTKMIADQQTGKIAN